MNTTADERVFNEKCIEHNLDARYLHSVMSEADSKFYFNELKDKIKWKNDYFNVFGKKILSPRQVAWYGDENMIYTYNRVKHYPLQWFDTLRKIKTLIEEKSNTKFNSVLINLYRDGNDSMGWHQDNEKSLGCQPIIASLSLGEQRRFMFRNKKKGITIELNLAPGSLLIMYGNSQKDWHHQLPKSKKIHNARINLTFRKIILQEKECK